MHSMFTVLQWDRHQEHCQKAGLNSAFYFVWLVLLLDCTKQKEGTVLSKHQKHLKGAESLALADGGRSEKTKEKKSLPMCLSCLLKRIKGRKQLGLSEIKLLFWQRLAATTSHMKQRLPAITSNITMIEYRLKMLHVAPLINEIERNETSSEGNIFCSKSRYAFPYFYMRAEYICINGKR